MCVVCVHGGGGGGRGEEGYTCTHRKEGSKSMINIHVCNIVAKVIKEELLLTVSPVLFSKTGTICNRQ